MNDPILAAIDGFRHSPAFSLASCDGSKFEAAIRRICQEDERVDARFARSSAMRDEAGLLREVAAAWQFPYYYGCNWNAFAECISDLSWATASSYLTVVFDSDELLEEAEADALSVFFRVIQRAQDSWTTPVHFGSQFDRPARSFGVVLHCAPANLAKWERRFTGFMRCISTP